MSTSRIDIIGQNGNDGDHYESICKHEFTIALRSMNLKMCRLCKLAVDWHLDEDQQPLVTSSKDRGL